MADIESASSSKGLGTHLAMVDVVELNPNWIRIDQPQEEVHRMHCRKGFTLIELMIVVVIIGILAAILVPSFMSMKDRASEAAVKSNGHTCQLAVEDFGAQNNGVYPPAATAADDIMANLPNGVLFRNPFTGEAGLSISAGAAAAEGMVDYSDPVVVGEANQYELNCIGRGDGNVILVI